MHSRIIQISKSPIRKDDFIDKDGFDLEDYGKFGIDYIADLEDSSRKDEIKEMESMFPLQIFKVKGKTSVLYKDNVWELKNLCVSKIKELVKNTDVEEFFDGDSYRLALLLKKPFTENLFVMDGCLYSSMNLINHLLKDNFSDGDTIYIGNILDYHHC